VSLVDERHAALHAAKRKKLEAGDPSVTLDLVVKSLVAVGASSKDMAFRILSELLKPSGVLTRVAESAPGIVARRTYDYVDIPLAKTGLSLNTRELQFEYRPNQLFCPNPTCLASTPSASHGHAVKCQKPLLNKHKYLVRRVHWQ
jgi:hypothetical protein